MSKSLDIEYTVNIRREGSQFVAHAMPLDVMSSGQNPEEARTALDEAVQLFLETADEIGTLEEVLLEVGYEFDRDKWNSPLWVATERHFATVGI